MGRAEQVPPATCRRTPPGRPTDAATHIRQAREQEKAERMLKILIDNRMDNIKHNHSRQLF
jgi:retron-type reverse transcriptase